MNGDSARVSITVEVPPDFAFQLFTQDIDRWWRHGRKYRQSTTRSSLIRLEPTLGGRLFETFERNGITQTWEVGQVTVWEPPERLAFTWSNANFSAVEQTEVEVRFEQTRSGALITLTHRGFGTLREDHPARHGLPAPEFVRMIGLWWKDQLTALRTLSQQRAL